MALKDHGVDFALDHRHLWIRMQSQWAILRVRATVISAIREWLDQNGFINMDTPILTPAPCEGTTTLFETEYFDEGSAYLAQSGQLYNEANIAAFGKVYCIRANLPRRKIQDPPPPDRILDGRTGSRLLRPGTINGDRGAIRRSYRKTSSSGPHAGIEIPGP